MDSYHHGRLREDLIARARTLVEDDPQGELPSLRELARWAGVTPTAVYHHFPSKEDLLMEVAVALLQDLVAAWQGQSLEAMGVAYLQYFRAHPAALALVFGSRFRSVGRLREWQDRAYQALVDRLPPRADGEPDHESGLVLWALVQGLAQLYAMGALGADPVACPGGPALWYQEPEAVLGALAPRLERLLTPS